MYARKSLVVTFLILVSVSSYVLTELPINAAAGILYVGGAGPGNYTSIQAAVDDSTPGDTVFVHSGTYMEVVVITKTLSLVGEDRDNTRIQSDTFNAVYVGADWVNITGFNVTTTGFSNPYGIRLDSVQNCRIEGNSAFDFHYGIALRYSENNTITSNLLGDNEYGLSVQASSNNTFIGNILIESGIVIGGDRVEHWNTHIIDTSNTVNGRPVYYLKDLSDGNAPTDAGQIIIANCHNMIIEDLNVINAHPGILLGFSHWNSISNNNGSLSIAWSNNNTISHNKASIGGNGIRLHHSMDNSVGNNTLFGGRIYVGYSTNNVVDNNTGTGTSGVRIHESFDTTVTHNFFSNGFDGIVSLASDSSLIAYNTILQSGLMGIYMDMDSEWNIIHHNNIMDNEYQAYDDSWSNYWHDGYPSGGNYWSDCNCIDQFSGPSQDQPGSDGISDNYYSIPGLWNGDPYPLMSPIPVQPSEPRNLQATAGNQQVALTWTPPEFDGFYPIIGYRIYRGTASGGGSFLTEIGNTSTYIDAGLTNGQTYYYTISALNFEKEGPKSEEVDATPGGLPGAPVGLAVTPGDQEVTLNWSAPLDDGGFQINSYNIYRGIAPDGETLLTAIGNLLGLLDTGLTNGVTYYYRVSAVNSVGEGARSNEASATPTHSTNQVPSCSITEPFAGAIISDTYPITGSATDSDGMVQRVEIRIDEGGWIEASGNSSWIYLWDTTTVEDGEHTIHVRSFDGEFYSADVFVTVKVDNPISDGPDDWLFVAVALSIVLVVVVVMLVYKLFKKRRIKGEEESNEPPLEEPPEPPPQEPL